MAANKRSNKQESQKKKSVMSTRPLYRGPENESEFEASKKNRKQKKKVLYLEIDDEITTVYDKLKQLKIKNIYLVAPKRATLFQSIVNLKILKRKAEDLGKNIFIITNDGNGIHLAKQVGLTVYDKLEGHEHPSLVSGKFWEDQQNITPLKASVNTIEEEMPTRQTERKLSISEIIKRGKHEGFKSLAKNLQNKPKENKKAKPESKLVLVAPNRQALISLVVFSLVILLTITYIALPGATIKLTPKSTILTTTSNIILADAEKFQDEFDFSSNQGRMVPSYSFSATIKKPLIYAATGEESGPGTTDASGFITIYNKSDKVWDLVTRTRFQTDDGLVFRIQQPVSVPPARGNTPGTLNVRVVADRYDVNNLIIGARGNLGPTRFFLPKLSEESRQKLYAENKEPFSGGNTAVIKKITKQDIETAMQKLKGELSISAQPALEQEIGKYNHEHNMDLVLLKDPAVITKSEPDVVIPENLEGKQLDSFELSGEMKVKGIAYDRNVLLGFLKLKQKFKENPEKRLVYVDEKSFTYKVKSEEDDDGDPATVFITATIKAIEEYEIRPGKENGNRFIKTIKDHLVGKTIQEAKDYLQNLKEIEKVTIDPWPIWSPTLPNIPDNIHVEILRTNSQ